MESAREEQQQQQQQPAIQTAVHFLCVLNTRLIIDFSTCAPPNIRKWYNFVVRAFCWLPPLFLFLYSWMHDVCLFLCYGWILNEEKTRRFEWQTHVLFVKSLMVTCITMRTRFIIIVVVAFLLNIWIVIEINLKKQNWNLFAGWQFFRKYSIKEKEKNSQVNGNANYI